MIRTVVALTMLLVAGSTSFENATDAQESQREKPKESQVYVFQHFYDDADQSVGSFALQRKENESGGCSFVYLDAKDTSKVFDTMEFDANGTEQSGLNQGIQNEAVLWFVKIRPRIGDSVSRIRRTKQFENGPDKGPTIIENTIVTKYLRTEILEVLGRKVLCHVVEEKAQTEGMSRDLKWLDHSGMPVRIVHIVGDETRTTLLKAKLDRRDDTATKRSKDLRCLLDGAKQ
ncbi:MAG: hypothetical protein AAF939_22645 [Planctomycetota bacterium]